MGSEDSSPEGSPATKPAFLSSQQRSISENCAVGLLTDDSEKHCLNRKQPEITFREQQNLSRSVCRTQKSRFLHEPASLEPKNVMFGTPRVALLKKERCCCKYDLILQQPLQDFKAIAGMNDVKLYGGVPPCSFH